MYIITLRGKIFKHNNPSFKDNFKQEIYGVSPFNT